jgi:Zn-dependent protease with chaperone function
VFFWFVVCLLLSSLLAINALASLGVEALWRAMRCFMRPWPARTRAQIIFTLRVFPLASALTVVAALILPSYLTYEPWPPDEVVTAKLAALTLISAIGIGLAMWRSFASLCATRRLVADWLCNAEAIDLEGAPVSAYRIRHPFPVIAMSGVIRPRLFIASQIFDSLNDDEITAAIRHEAGHLAMRHNLKRALMRVCRDVLMILPCGRILDRDWSEAAEAAADEYAARAGAASALDLALALIKIVRLIPEGMKPTRPAGAFLIDDDVDGVAWRVRQLTRLAEMSKEAEERGAITPQLAMWACPYVLLAGLACTAASPAVLARLHEVLEQIFWFLS